MIDPRCTKEQLLEYLRNVAVCVQTEKLIAELEGRDEDAKLHDTELKKLHRLIVKLES